MSLENYRQILSNIACHLSASGNHDISLCTTFCKDEFRVLQASEEELFVKTVNDLKPLKAVIAKISGSISVRIPRKANFVAF